MRTGRQSNLWLRCLADRGILHGDGLQRQWSRILMERLLAVWPGCEVLSFLMGRFAGGLISCFSLQGTKHDVQQAMETIVWTEEEGAFAE